MIRQGRKRMLEDVGDGHETGVCILHFKDSKCGQLTFISRQKDPDERLEKLLKIRNDRRSEPAGSPYRMDDVCDQIPETLSPLHGYHRDCYQRFCSNLNRLKNCQNNTSFEENSRERDSRRAGGKKEKIIFNPDCIFCNKDGRKSIYRYGVKTTEGLIKFENGGGANIFDVAEKKNDEKLLRRIRGYNLFSCEAQFHRSCRIAYLQDPSKWRSKDEQHVKDNLSLVDAHRQAFDAVCQVMNKSIINDKEVLRLSDLNGIYIRELEKTPHANPKHRGEKLKNRIEKSDLKNVIGFAQVHDDGKFRSYLVYNKKMDVGEAVMASYLLGRSNKTVELANLLREDVLETFRAQEDLPWPPVVEKLPDQNVLPRKLEEFLRVMLPRVKSGTKVERLVNSIGQDLCRAITNGKWKLPKHIILGMSLRHLFRSTELINLLNRLGHCENYSFLLEIETSIAMALENASSFLAVNIVRNPSCTSVFHSDFDNYDEFINDLGGAGSVHRSHGIMLQELGTKEEDVGGFTPTVENIPRTGRRSLPGAADVLPECRMGKRKSPSYVIAKTEPDDGVAALQQSTLHNLIWVLLRLHASNTDETQIIPAWSGYISSTGDVPARLTTIEYYPIISQPITEFETVQECLQYSETATREVGQKYVITSFDLGVCMKAYPLVWSTEQRYQDHIILMGSFHLACAYLKMIGKKMGGSGLSDVLLEAGLITTGSLIGVLKGKNYARAMNCHKVMVEALERMLFNRYLTDRNEDSLFASLPEKSKERLQKLLTATDKQTESQVLGDPIIIEYLTNYLGFKDNARQGKLGKTAQLWISYMDHIWLLLHLMRAVKTNNYALYIQCLCLMPDLFFSYGGFNYARYLTYFSTFLVNIELSHPGATELLRQGAFSVARSFIPGNRCAVDKTIEETFMRHSKSRGGGASGAGLSGIQTNYNAYQRWCRSTKERAKYLKAAYGMADMMAAGETGSEHKDMRSAEKRRGEKLVQETIATFENFVNPYDMADEEHLVCISSGLPAAADIEHDVLRAESAGSNAKQAFIEERLKKGAAFFDPIKQLKLKTMDGMKKVINLRTSQQKEIQYSQQGSIAFQLLVKSQDLQNDKLNLLELMSYQLTPVPYSLALANGSLSKTNKSKGMHKLTDDHDSQPISANPAETMLIEDGNAVFHSLQNLPGTFAGIAQKILECSALKTKSPCVFSTDMYTPQSIKAMERTRRGVGEKLILRSGKMKRPKDWKSFLSNDENKTQLVRIILETWSSPALAHILGDHEVTLICEGRAYQLISDGKRVSTKEIESLRSTQEETDTRVILYCIFAKERGFQTVRVKSPDTDIFFILLHHAHRLNDIKILFETGKGRTKRCLDISTIADSLSPILCNALLGLHCFTGCDSTSAFRAKGKVRPLNLLMKNESFQKTFAELGESWAVPPDTATEIEHFTCQMYGEKRLKTVNDVRHVRLLAKCGTDGILRQSRKVDFAAMPPCQSTLIEHVKRVNYQVRVWKCAHILEPDIPDPTDGHGWTTNDKGILEPKWSGKEVLPVELVDILETIEQDESEVESEDEEDSEESDDDSDGDEEDEDDAI